MNKIKQPGLLAMLLVMLALPYLLPNNYAMDIAIRIMLTGTAVVGLNILMGFAGQISIGHAAFIAIGAYGSTIATSRFGWSPLLAAAATAVAAALLAWLIAKPILRLKGHSLTMAPLGFGMIVNMILINEVDWTGGPDGMPVPPLAVAGFTFAKLGHWYALAAAMLFLAVLFSLNLFTSPAGRALRGLNGSEVAAKGVGVDVGSFKMKAFVSSAVFATVAGSCTAHYIGFVSPSLAAFTHSVELATMVVLGGMGSTFGAVLGVALLVLLPQLLGGMHEYEALLFGLILMLTMIYLPGGLVPSLALKLRRSLHA